VNYVLYALIGGAGYAAGACGADFRHAYITINYNLYGSWHRQQGAGACIYIYNPPISLRLGLELATYSTAMQTVRLTLL
jgi:hypothetical protein